MDKRMLIIRLLLGVLLPFFISGCVNYGKFEPVKDYSDSAETMTIQRLVDNWKDYDVYYRGTSHRQTRGIMFDPKNDDRKVTGKYWVLVDNENTFSELISWSLLPGHEPNISRILGPDEQLYGYMLFKRRYVHAVVKLIESNTLQIQGMSYGFNTRIDRSE